MSISIQNVGRDFRSQWALREVNAQIDAGSTVAVLGANGAGKSTLLRLIAGWIPPAEGRIQIQGHTMRINSMSVRRRLMSSAVSGPITQTGWQIVRWFCTKEKWCAISRLAKAWMMT